MILRTIAPIATPGVEPAALEGFFPEFEIVAPQTLTVDEDYQRNLSDRSISLIRRIVANWSWRAFKPPVCVRVDDGLHVIDGQHTAIAAASHPGVERIPILVLPPGDRRDRAMAFVRHNRDRVQVTPQQVHFALLAAGDDDALTLANVCESAGARVLKHPPSFGRFEVGDIMAIGALRALCGRRYAVGAGKVVRCCVEARLAPVSVHALKAVEDLLFGDSYAGQVDAGDLALTIRDLGTPAEKDAARFAAEHDLPFWKGLVVTWFRALKTSRRLRRPPGAEAADPVAPKPVAAPVTTPGLETALLSPPPPTPPPIAAPTATCAALGIAEAAAARIGGQTFARDEMIVIEALLARPQVRRKHFIEAAAFDADIDERGVQAIVARARVGLARIGVSIGESAGSYWLDLGAKQRVRVLLDKAKGAA
jgi:hypothetical protein